MINTSMSKLYDTIDDKNTGLLIIINRCNDTFTLEVVNEEREKFLLGDVKPKDDDDLNTQLNQLYREFVSK